MSAPKRPSPGLQNAGLWQCSFFFLKAPKPLAQNDSYGLSVSLGLSFLLSKIDGSPRSKLTAAGPQLKSVDRHLWCLGAFFSLRIQIYFSLLKMGRFHLKI